MASNADYFLKKTLGDDFFESLNKFELWKPGTRTTVDHEEIKTALMIVPRAIMAILIRELSPMKIGETKEVSLPINGNAAACLLRITKHERDVYSGDITEDSKVAVDFKYRSIPGVGLVVMSAFELYDTSTLVDNAEKAPTEDVSKKVQSLIDERLALYDLIGKVVDKKIMERDGVHQMFLRKLSELVTLSRETAPMSDPYFRGMANGVEVVNAVANNQDPKFVEAPKKVSPLKDFLGKREQKKNKTEFSIEMVKGETVRCPDCDNALISGEVFTGCVCLGEDMDKKLFMVKTEHGVKVRFGRGWDAENIEMLLEVLRRKRGR